MIFNTIKSYIAASLMAAAISTSAFAAGPAPTARESRQAQLQAVEQLRAASREARAKAAVKPDAAPAKADPSEPVATAAQFGYLESPIGETWFYSLEQTADSVTLPGGFAWDVHVTGFTYKIYDSAFNLVGEVTDTIRFEEDEIRLATMFVDPSVTRKFFNINDNYELSVSMVYNHPDYSITSRTYIYSIGTPRSAEGYDVPVACYQGLINDAINTSSNIFTEDYYITFFNETSGDPADYEDYLDYLASCYNVMTTYKKAGWGGGPEQIGQFKVCILNAPGDQMNLPFFITVTNPVGELYAVVSEYEKSFMVDPTGMGGDETITPDNSLLINAYKLNSSKTGFDEPTQTVIPCQIKGGDILASYYGVGALNYGRDILFDGNEISGYVVTVQDYSLSEDDSYSNNFYHYSINGQLLGTIAEKVTSFVSLTDLPDLPMQTMMIRQHEDGPAIFDIVNIPSGERVLSMQNVVEGDIRLSATMDRAYRGSQLCYVFYASGAKVDDDGNCFTQVVWVDTDGELVKIDKLNLGPDIALTKMYMESPVLQPYVFNTDDEYEYLLLLKRYVNTGQDSRTQESMVVVGPESGIILEAGPSELGVIANVTPIFDAMQKQLVIVYNNDYRFTPLVYNLPLTRFDGGKGTASNPYLITTVGDLQQIASLPTAHFALVNDLDATGYSVNAASNFSGSIDGRGHSITGLRLAQGGLIRNTSPIPHGDQPRIVNLTLIDPVVVPTSTYSAVIAGQAANTLIENVNIFGLRVDDPTFEGNFGAITAFASNFSTIQACYVADASIQLPEASSVGGIVGFTRTSSTITACAFTGSILASNTIGGIVGSMTADERLSNCHVDADITGRNTIGGIVGSCGRTLISKCYVEGSLRATEPGRWQKEIALGGLIGNLEPYVTHDAAGNPVFEPSPVIISGSVINIASITYPEIDSTPQWEGQFNTVHRLVGLTGENLEPEPIDYGPNDEPIFGDPYIETGLANNYVISPVEPIDGTSEALEGTTIARSALDADFFEAIYWNFGETVAAPWRPMSFYDPRLYFESSIAMLEPAISTEVGATFTVDMRVLGRGELTIEQLMDDFTCEYPEQLIEMTGNMSYINKVLSLEFRALAQGEGSIEVGLLGSKAAATVTVAPASAIEEIDAPSASTLTFDGTTLRAPGQPISLYDLTGTLVATGFDALTVGTLPRGIYIAATPAATLKIALTR